MINRIARLFLPLAGHYEFTWAYGPPILVESVRYAHGAWTAQI